MPEPNSFSYEQDIADLRAYLASGPALESQTDAVILLYKVFKELDRLDTLPPLLGIKDHLSALETDVRTLVNSQLADLEQAIIEAVQDLTPTKTIHVSMGGNDINNSGNKLAPVRSLSVAIQKAIALNPTLTAPVQIRVHPGTYLITAPLALPRNVSLVGDSYNSVELRPTNDTDTNNLILVDSNSTIQNITFSNYTDGAFAIAFNPEVNNTTLGAIGSGAYIQRPVLITDCISITATIGDVVEKLIVNNDLSGGAVEVDGNKCAINSPIRGMVINHFKAENYNGIGFLVKNSAQAHLTKCVSSYVRYHLRCETGGLAFANGCINNYGLDGLIAHGYNSNSEGSGVAEGLATQSTLTISNLSAGALLYRGSIIQAGFTPNYTVYIVKDITPIGINQLQITLDRPLEANLNSEVTFHKRSKIFATNHYFNHVGSGIDSRAWIENRTLADKTRHILEEDNGIIIYTSVDSDGNINLNKAITIDGITGDVTIENTNVFGLEGLEPNFQLDPETREITQNITNTVDGVVPRPFSFNPYNFTSEQIQLLADRINGGSTYQLFVDVDNPNASDSKTNRGNTSQRPFRTVERALIETARRSFAAGPDNDIYNRVSIYVAPGIYNLNNGRGGVIENEFYNRFQDASNLVQLNQEEIAESAYNNFIFLPDDTLELRTSLKSNVYRVVTTLVDDLSSLGNKETVNLARSFVKTDAPDPGQENPGSPGFTQATFLAPYYFNLLVDNNGNERNNSLLGALSNAISYIRDQAILAVQNKGAVKNTTITVDPDLDENAGILACANVITAIENYAEILLDTLASLINPYNININIGTAVRFFPETEEPTDAMLQSFNDPVEPGIILPRGVSLIGADLRKVIFKPKYVPDPTDSNTSRSSIFRMTGGNFFQGFTVLDQDPQFRSYNPAFSHHKLSAFAFCTLQDLELYYNNITLAFADRRIYNKAQDASNLIEANYDWLIDKLTLAIEELHPTTQRYGVIYNAQLSYYIQALIYDLKQLGKVGVEKFAQKFRRLHIDPLIDPDNPDAITPAISFYKTHITNSFNYLIQAINNLANESEGGVRDYRIIYDNNPQGQCTDVVSAVNNYLTIIKSIIEGTLVPNIINDRFIVSDAEAIDSETSIVIPSGALDPNTVQGASPYIFSASVRSEYGMCGIDGDGSRVTGLKSYLAAQFTIISLQKDNRAFTLDGAEVEINNRRYKGSILTHFTQPDAHDDWRHFGYRVTNGAYSQLVSCFCICPAVHYWAATGGEFSITNSTSNFGDIALYAEGFNSTTYPQDSGVLLAGIIKPLDLPAVRNRIENQADNFPLGRILSMTDVSDTTKIITLNGPGKYLDLYTIDNPDRICYVYVNGLDPDKPRRGRVVSKELNTVTNRLSITIDLTGSTDTDLWGIWTTDNSSEALEASIINREFYIKRFIDTRKSIDKEYRLVLRHNFNVNTGLNGKRRPVIHYVLQKTIEDNELQPFELDLNETRSLFYILNIRNLNDDNDFGITVESTGKYYDAQIATINANNFGQLETELDLNFNSRIDLDFDPSDANLSLALNLDSSYEDKTYSRQNLEILLTKLGKSNLLNQLDVNSTRFINLDSINDSEDIKLNFNKPSLIRCGSQTWEYMGYYNYSTGLPQFQQAKLGESLNNDTLIRNLRIDKTQTSILGGRVYATGMDEEGNSYVGNTIIDLKTGQQETIVRGSSDEVLQAFEIPEISELGDLTITGRLTLTSSATLAFETIVDGNGNSDSVDLINFTPATVDQPGIAEIADNQEVIAEILNDKIITPANLKHWRITNKLVSNAVKATTIYITNRAAQFHSLSGSRRNSDPLHGNVVTWTAFRTNQENGGANDIPIWQLSDPNKEHFRCLGSMADLSSYGNANFTTNDQLTLFIDPGKYRADYTYNFGIVINGANNRRFDGWGNPDGSDITEDGNSGGVILYVTCNVAPQISTSSLTFNSTAITFNSQSNTQITYVHFWSHVTAIKDLDTEWNIKAKNENTFEQFLIRANNAMWVTYGASLGLNVREQYNGSWAGFNKPSPVIRLRESGLKQFAYCTFSGQGVSVPAYDRGGNYNGGYIYVIDSCDFQLRNIVLRGNEEIRFSDKHGRFVTTIANTTPVLMPPAGYLTEDQWTYAPIYNNTGGIITSNIYTGTYAGCFHDPFTEEWVSIGFTDKFIGVGQNARVRIELQGNSFRTGLSFFGSTELVGYTSTDKQITGVFTINNDIHNIRLEKNTGKLFGLADDRTFIKNTSESATGDARLYFRGTDNLGRKVNELHPPTLVFDANGVVEPSLEASWHSWVDSLRDQGPIIVQFTANRFAYTLTSRSDYDIWTDRDSTGLIRGQGFLGEFGYIPRITDFKLQPIQSWNFSSSTYGTTITWALNGVGCKYQTGNQYHYNFFRPAWKGLRVGKYQHPAIIDIGSNFTTLSTDLVNNGNDYSILAPYIEGVTYTKQSVINPEQLHILDGQIVGAMFYIVGVDETQLLPVMYTGYDYDNGNKVHKFIRISGSAGVSNYFTAKTNNYIFDTIEALLLPGLSSTAGTQVYIKESNLFLTRTLVNGVDNGASSIRSWSPLALSPGYTVLHNLANMGLFGTMYKRGFFIEKLGLECNTETDYNSLSSIPDHPQLRSGRYANTTFSGLEIFITTSGNIVL